MGVLLFVYWIFGHSVEPPVEPTLNLRPTPPRPVLRRVPQAQIPLPVSPPAPSALTEATEQVAKALQQGWIRCNLGSDVPDGPATGSFAGWVAGGVLTARVQQPGGSSGVFVTATPLGMGTVDVTAAIEERSVPLARIRWSGAEPGQEGRCEALTVRPVRISGRVVGEEPVHGVSIEGCGATAVSDMEGAFEVRAWEGVPCELRALQVRGTRSRVSDQVGIWPEPPGLTGIELRLGPVRTAYERAVERRRVAEEGLEAAQEELQRYEEIEATEEASSWVKRWANERREAVQRQERTAEAAFNEQDVPDRFVPFGGQPAD